MIIVARHATRLVELTPRLLGPRVELINADVRSLDDLFGADVVVHAAASANAIDYRMDADAEGETIVQGTANVMRLASAAKRPPKILFVSSGAVYGKQPAGVPFLRESARLCQEQDPGKRAYAAAKRVAEGSVREAARRGLVSASIARCFAFVGPWLPRDRHFAMGAFLGQALAGTPIVVNAVHPVIRSYMYSDDLVEWLMAIAVHASVRCPVFNVGSGEAIEIRDLATIIGGMANVPVRVPVPDPTSIPDRYVPDVSLAQRSLGVSLKVPLRLALERTLHLSIGSERSLESAGGRWGQ